MRGEAIAIGTTVVAVQGNQGNKLFVFGRGVYEGNFIPPYIDFQKELPAIQAEYHERRKSCPELPEVFNEDDAKRVIVLSHANPRIRLTETLDGKPLDEVIWGYECWWSTEEEFKERTPEGKYEINTVTVADHRKEMEAEAAEEGEGIELEVIGLSSGTHVHGENCNHSQEN